MINYKKSYAFRRLSASIFYALKVKGQATLNELREYDDRIDAEPIDELMDGLKYLISKNYILLLNKEHYVLNEMEIDLNRPFYFIPILNQTDRFRCWLEFYAEDESNPPVPHSWLRDHLQLTPEKLNKVISEYRDHEDYKDNIIKFITHDRAAPVLSKEVVNPQVLSKEVNPVDFPNSLRDVGTWVDELKKHTQRQVMREEREIESKGTTYHEVCIDDELYEVRSLVKSKPAESERWVKVLRGIERIFGEWGIPEGHLVREDLRSIAEWIK